MSAPFLWPEGKQAAVSLSFDDSRPSQIQRGIPVLDRYAARATFYVMPQRVAQDPDSWKRVVATGHEVGNHTVSHPCSGNFHWARAQALEDFSLEKMGAELDTASSRIQALLGVTPATFAYPCGQKFVGRGAGVRSYVPLVADRFVAGRGFRDECPNDPTFCDLAQLAAVDGDDAPFEAYLAWIERARLERGWLILAAHDVGAGGRQTVREDALEALCRYCQDPDHGIWIDTVAAIASYIRDTRLQG